MDLTTRGAGTLLHAVSDSPAASGTKQFYRVGPRLLLWARLSRRSAAPQKPLRADRTVTQRRRLDPRRVTTPAGGGAGIETLRAVPGVDV